MKKARFNTFINKFLYNRMMLGGEIKVGETKFGTDCIRVRSSRIVVWKIAFLSHLGLLFMSSASVELKKRLYRHTYVGAC